MDNFLKEHKLTRNNAVKRILANNRPNKAERILNSGKEGGFRSGYLKNLSDTEWNSIVRNLNSVEEGLSNNQKQVFRKAAEIRQTHKLTTFSGKAIRGSARAIAKVAPRVIAGAAAVYGARKLVQFAQSNQGRKLIGNAVTGIKKYMTRVKSTPNGAPIPEPNKNLSTRLAQLGGPTAVRELYENGFMSNINFRNSNIRNAFKHLQNAAAIQSATAAGIVTGGTVASLAGRGAGAAVVRGYTGNGLRQGAQAAQRIMERTGQTQQQLQAARRVAAARNAAARATRGANTNVATKTLKIKQGLTFGEGVQAVRRMTNTTRAALNRQRMRAK